MSPERWQQIARLFDAVLEQEPPRRAAFLSEACAGDTELRREVESLLAARDRAGSFLRMDALDNEASQIAAAQTALLTGQRIAHFEVLSPLGAGAMGEVYLARDTRLDRKVALKLLPVRFTLDASRLRRFEREARAASSLNHPNIITVYEVGADRGQDGDRHFIATEYVEGVTLRERHSSGPLPLKEALNLAIGIASALEAAHTSGIVHRDIKPENVMVRPDGVIKVLDFGIAKLTEKAATGDAPPPSNYSTEQGTVIGTPGYMSPEQARGVDVDARTDVFSLGVVLYEMIAERAPFGGATYADAIASLLEKEPQPLEHPSPGVAQELNRICRKALAKDASARYQKVEELRKELLFLSENLGDFESAAVKPTRPVNRITLLSRRSMLAVAGTVLAVMIVALAFNAYYHRLEDRSSWANPANWRTVQAFTSRSGLGPVVAISPDGKFAAYSLNNNEGSSLWTRQITVTGADSQPPRKIASGEWRDRNPVWSPDGQRLAFISDRGGRTAIWTISLSGDDATMIQELNLTTGSLVGWRRDQGREEIYYELLPNLFALDVGSRQVRQITRSDPGRSLAHDFSLSPDARRIVYVDRVGELSFVMLKELPDGVPTPLTPGEKESYRSPSWFPDGNRIAYAVDVSGTMQIGLVWLDSRERMQITSGGDDFDRIRVLPNGRAILALSNRENANIRSCDLRTGVEAEPSQELGVNLLPEISFDGKYVAFKIGAGRVRAVESISIKPLDQANGVQAAALPSFTIPGSDARWSPNNDALAFIKSEGTGPNLWKFSLSDKKESLLAVNVDADGYSRMPYNRLFTNFNWSPDGARLIYLSNKSGHHNLWSVNSDGSGDRQLTNNLDPKTKFNSPVWSPEGQDLAYLVRVPGQQPEKQTRKVYVMRDGISRQVFEQDRGVRIVGWLPPAPRLLIAVGVVSSPQEVELVICPSNGSKPQVVSRLSNVYLPSLRLSKDKRFVAYVSRQNGVDNIEAVSVSDWSVRKVTENRDQTLFYSGLDWHPTEGKLFYSRQTNWGVISLVEKIR